MKKQTKIKAEENVETENIMRKVRIEKVILSSGATAQDLEKAKKLLEFLSGKHAHKISSTKRIPDFGVRPGLEVGTRVTLRGDNVISILKKLLGAIDNVLSEDQITENGFSFGIKEYIEIPGIEYQRDIGIRGLNVTVVFNRAGVRTSRKKIKVGKLAKKQHVSPEEIISYMSKNFNTEVN